MALKKNDLVLFIGDSITDCGRNREDGNALGNGYVHMIHAALSVLRPDLSLQVLNRGISGDKTRDVLDRLDEDCLSLRPAMISVFMGINDVWHRLFGTGLTDAETEENYRACLSQIRRTLGEIPLLILEPFLTPDTSTGIPREEVERLSLIVRRLASEFSATFVDLDAPLLKACEALLPHTLSEDGVHPTKEGHSVIAKHWLDAALPLL